MDLLLDPFRPVFMQRAMWEVLLLAIPAGALGAWVVARRLAFMTHAVGHATFPALVVATVVGVSVLTAGIVAAVAVALVLVWLHRQRGLAGGTAVAIVLTTALALGSVIVSASDVGVRTNSLLFGSLLAITDADLWSSAGVAAGTLACLTVFWRPLMASAFDGEVATAQGINPRIIEMGVAVLLAICVAVSIRAVGSLLVAGFFLVPAATARLAAKRLATVMVWGAVIAAACGVTGMWTAYHLNAPPGACIASIGSALWGLVAAVRTLTTGRTMRTITT